MPLTPEQITMLDAPINPALVKVKPTPGSPKFIEGHEAMNAANRIFGYDGWGYTVNGLERLEAPGGILYRALVTVSVVGCLPKQDIGSEIASNTKGGDAPSVQAHETAMKGAVTDGIKRALRSFGDQFGASLYDKDADLRAEYAAWQREQVPAQGNGAEASPAPPKPKDTTARAVAVQRAQDLLSRDPGARAKLPKPLEAQTEGEIQATIDWLVKRANAAKQKVEAQANANGDADASRLADLHTLLRDHCAEDPEGAAVMTKGTKGAALTSLSLRQTEDWLRWWADRKKAAVS